MQRQHGRSDAGTSLRSHIPVVGLVGARAAEDTPQLTGTGESVREPVSLSEDGGGRVTLRRLTLADWTGANVFDAMPSRATMAGRLMQRRLRGMRAVT